MGIMQETYNGVYGLELESWAASGVNSFNEADPWNGVVI